MSSDEESSDSTNNEEIDEGDKYTDGSGTSSESAVSEESAEEIYGEQSTNRTEEEEKDATPEEKEVEQVEPSISETEAPETTTSKEEVNETLEGSKGKQRTKKEISKLFDQFTKHFQVSKLASDKTMNILKQIQKQLTHIDKRNVISIKQQVVIRQLASQLKTMQQQLDKISSSVNRIKIVTNIKGKSGNSKRKKK